MRYFGKIDRINQIIISDPSYEDSVTCRYEKNNLELKNWNVNLDIKEYSEKIEGIECRGLDFTIILKKSFIKCELSKDNDLIIPTAFKTKQFEIGIDTACIAMGINECARDIKESKDDWQPCCALNTLSDGYFGSVIEGRDRDNKELNFICITGYLDEDTGYSIDDIVDYIKENFEIKDLKKEKETKCINGIEFPVIDNEFDYDM